MKGDEMELLVAVLVAKLGGEVRITQDDFMKAERDRGGLEIYKYEGYLGYKVQIVPPPIQGEVVVLHDQGCLYDN